MMISDTILFVICIYNFLEETVICYYCTEAKVLSSNDVMEILNQQQVEI